MSLPAKQGIRPPVIHTSLTRKGLKRIMINLVAINQKEKNAYPRPCHFAKCPNPGRYQYFGSLAADELPDWEGDTICSKHLVEEARHRPEIVMSLIDALIDAMEENELL